MAQGIEEKIGGGTTAVAPSTIGDIEKGGDSKENKPKVRTGDKDNEEMVIPKNRLVIVFIGLMLTVFLAALDQTIVCTSFFSIFLIIATALPTIVQDLKGGQDYSWVGTSYLLASAAFTPLYGRVRYIFLWSLLMLATSSVGNLSFMDLYLFSSWGLHYAALPRVFHSLIAAYVRYDLAHTCASSSGYRCW